MSQKYLLVPLPVGLFYDYDLSTRAVLGALYGRYRLSGYNLMGDESGTAWYDPVEEHVYCVYTYAELCKQLGISERSVRRCLDRLRDDGLIWWRKASYGGANRYYLHERITQELSGQQSGQIVTPNPASVTGLIRPD